MEKGSMNQIQLNTWEFKLKNSPWHGNKRLIKMLLS